MNGLSAIGAVGASVAPVSATGYLPPPDAGAGTGDTPFAAAMSGLDHVSGLQSTADSLAVQAATGRLEDVHDYTLAATQAKLATELTVTVRNKAVEAFNEIMRMNG